MNKYNNIISFWVNKKESQGHWSPFNSKTHKDNKNKLNIVSEAMQLFFCR